MKKQKRCDNHPSRVRKVYFRILIKEITIHFLYISNNCWKKEKVVERKSRMMWKKAEPKNIKRFRFFFFLLFLDTVFKQYKISKQRLGRWKKRMGMEKILGKLFVFTQHSSQTIYFIHLFYILDSFIHFFLS